MGEFSYARLLAAMDQMDAFRRDNGPTVKSITAHESLFNEIRRTIPNASVGTVFGICVKASPYLPQGKAIVEWTDGRISIIDVADMTEKDRETIAALLFNMGLEP